MRFYVLGTLHIQQDSGGTLVPVQLPRLHKTQSLLAYLLVLRDRPHSREYLTSLFWGDSRPDRARNSLSAALTQLRPLLQESGATLDADRHSLRFSLGAAWLDLAVVEQGIGRDAPFDRVAQAVQLYEGDLLDNWSDEWCIDKREKVRQEVISAGTRLVRHYLQEGEWEQGARVAEKLLAHDPFDEQLHELLLRCLLGGGSYSEARRQYERSSEFLRKELGTEIGPAVQELYAGAIAQLREKVSLGAGTPAHVGPEQMPPVRTPLPTPQVQLPLVGRAAQQAVILRALSRLRAEGKGGMLLVRGEAGTGKTRLADEAIVSQGRVRVARGRANQIASELPFAPLLAPLTHWLLEELAPQQVLSRIGPTAAAALAQVLPPLSARIPNLRPLPPLPAKEAQTRLLQSVVSALLASVAPGSPAVLLLDDLQWADPQTLQVLEQLRPMLPTSQLLVLAIFRTEDVPQASSLARLVADIERESASGPSSGTDIVDLRPLQLADIHRLIEPRLPPDRAALSEWIFTRSRGIPFYVAELLRGLQEKGTIVPDPTVGGWRVAVGVTLPRTAALDVPSLQEAVLQRFATLSPNAQLVCRIAAVMAEEVSFDFFMEAGGLSEEATILAIEEALNRRFMQEGGERGYTLAHDLVREALARGLSPPRRLRLHTRLAETLERAPAALVPPGQESALSSLVRLAYHYGHTSNTDKQRHYFTLVADTAQAAYANEVAIDYYRRLIPMLPLAERPEVMFKLAMVLYVVSRWPESEAVCREALAIAEQTGNIEQIVRAKLEISMQLRLRDAYEEGLKEDYEAEALLATIENPDKRLVLKAKREIGANLYILTRYRESAEIMQVAVGLARELGDLEAICKLLSRLGDIYADLGDHERSVRYQEEALTVARQMGDPTVVAWVVYALGRTYRYAKDPQRAVPLLLESLDLIEQTGYQALLSAVIEAVGWSYSLYGEHNQAYRTACYDLQIAINDASSSLYSLPYALTEVADVYQARGEIEAAEACLARARTIAATIDDLEDQAFRLLRLAQLAQARNDYNRAASFAREAAERAIESSETSAGFAARLLQLFLETKVGALSAAEAIAECDSLLEEKSSKDDRAAILYTMWQIEPGSEGRRSAAADLYLELYRERPIAEYRSRYTELTGSALPDPPPLPPLPDSVPVPPSSPDGLLQAVDEIICALPHR